MRSIAGSVAPIAAVAGSNSTNMPAKATQACQAGGASGPVKPSSQAPAVGMPRASTSAHSAMSTSQPAYQRAGRRLASMRALKHQAPSAMPPKKALTTASSAAASCPSHSAPCCVHTSW